MTVILNLCSGLGRVEKWPKALLCSTNLAVLARLMLYVVDNMSLVGALERRHERRARDVISGHVTQQLIVTLAYSDSPAANEIILFQTQCVFTK